jgi:exopolysaccharide production protein ExoF
MLHLPMLRKMFTLIVTLIVPIGMTSAHGETSIVDEALLTANKHSEAPADVLRIGDKINLTVFERLVRQEERWRPQQQVPDLSRSFIQRAELSGERTVQDNGTMSLPFLGQIPAEGLTSKELESAVSRAFEQAFQRPAFVTVLSIEHDPIFVVGPVKNPGSYKYSTRMTVLHAIALAGGTERSREGAWLDVEAIREASRAEHLRVNVSRALARATVLRAERDGNAVTVPPRLALLLGDAQAKAAIEDQRALRSLAVSMHGAREAALRSAAVNAKTELELAKDRIAPLDASTKLRSERLNAMSSLNSKGIASRAQLIEVQSALSDIEAKKQEALSAVAAANRRFEQANADMTAFQLEYRTQLELEMLAADRETLDHLDSIAASQGTLVAMQAQNPAKKALLSFEIVRRTADGTRKVAADEVTELVPGDLVRVNVRGTADERENTTVQKPFPINASR